MKKIQKVMVAIDFSRYSGDILEYAGIMAKSMGCGLIIVNVAVDLPSNLWPAIVVGVTVLVLCLGAHVEMLSSIPTAVLGYAATAALMISGGAMDMDHLAAANFSNPLILISVSLVVGAIFGLLSGKLAGALGKG